MKPLADTGLLVGFLDRTDQYHAWAADCFAELRTSVVYTTDKRDFSVFRRNRNQAPTRRSRNQERGAVMGL